MHGIPKHYRKLACCLPGVGLSLWIFLFVSTLAAADPTDERVEIEVRFTNPECPSRPYLGYFQPTLPSAHPQKNGFQFAPPTYLASSEIPLQGGGFRSHTKPGTYCFWQDAAPTDARATSVLQRVRKMIEATEAGDSISISTFSFSNLEVSQLLCDALERGVHVSAVIGTDSVPAQKLAHQGCGGNKMTLKNGAAPGGGRLQHAKFMLTSRKIQGISELSFQSANISSGVNLHHENWSFVTLPSDDPFIQEHACQFQALQNFHFNDQETGGITAYRKAHNTCVQEIGNNSSSIAIEGFFIPGMMGGQSEGKQALAALIREIENADSVDVISHHLTHPDLLKALRLALEDGREVRIIMDDELYWVGHSAIPRENDGRPLYVSRSGNPAITDTAGVFAFDHYSSVALHLHNCERGASFSRREFQHIQELMNAGAEVKFLETNHRSWFFQHNKFLIMRRNSLAHSVFTGAGNLSKAAFTRNGENFYLITEEDMTSAFARQFDWLWEELATWPAELPLTWATHIQGDESWRTWVEVIRKEKRSCE